MSVETFDLKALRAELLKEQIRRERAEAEISELQLTVAREQEQDRLAKTGYNRILNIVDPIVGETVPVYTGALEHWARREGDRDRKITININSPGGSVMDGLALYDTILRLRRQGISIVTRGTGYVASMAVVVLQAGEERIADANAHFLIHELAGGSAGRQKISDRRDEAKMMERLNKRLIGILAERSTLTADEIFERSEYREWYLEAEEALDLGFVDRIE